MPEENSDGERSWPDLLGLILLGFIALGTICGAVWFAQQHEFTTSGLLLAIIIGGAFVFAHHGPPKATPPRNTHVHGAARAASEQEARRAARGEAQAPRLDDQEF